MSVLSIRFSEFIRKRRFCVNIFNERVQQFLTSSSERWLTYRNEDAPQKKIVAAGILVFDF